MSPKTTYRWPKHTWKDVLTSLIIRENKSKLPWRSSSHRSAGPSSKSPETINAGEGVEKREFFYTVSGNINFCNHYGEQYDIDIEVAQSCPTLCYPMGCSLPGSSVHGIFQARVLEWVAISFSRGSSQPRDQTQGSNPGLPHCRQTLYRLSHQGSPGTV